ncbi:MAG: hypothetical protein QOJ50_1344, partial [Cryptosporangiaceae bacterium]|nr:hypothetical protein [Cryptosporangiaceae bacterium]
SSGERCRSLKALLSTVTRPTLWVRAAIATLDGGIAAHDGTFAEAAAHFADAVAIYDRMGDLHDATLASAWTARAWNLAGDAAAAGDYERRVEHFAERNTAPRLVELMRMGPLPD